ncbi:MAG: hypothetical protein ACI9KF_001020 [Arenicella sp.]|jgi:hypothetical protein
MKRLKGKELLLIDKMRQISYFFLFMFFASCTSNTIFEKPKDLIPKDTMSLLLQEMVISSSAKFIKNKNNQKNINYMPFVYENFKIDSTRFKSSNYYYMSKIDLYQEILENAQDGIVSRQDVLTNIKTVLDSIKKDSIQGNLNKLKRGDSLQIIKNLKDLENPDKILNNIEMQ